MTEIVVIIESRLTDENCIIDDIIMVDIDTIIDILNLVFNISMMHYMLLIVPLDSLHDATNSLHSPLVSTSCKFTEQTWHACRLPGHNAGT